MTLNDFTGCMGLKERVVATGNRLHLTAAAAGLTEHIVTTVEGLKYQLPACGVQSNPRQCHYDPLHKKPATPRVSK